jgi:7-cyano-7-deazaguanine synthase
MKEKRVLVALSGGMDSTTVLARAIEECPEPIVKNQFGQYASKRTCVMAIGIDYGSKHNEAELDCAENVASHYGVLFAAMDIDFTDLGINSALINSERPVPTGHYEQESMRSTVVPGRNLIILSILAGIAEAQGFDEVWIGAHSGDHFIYPDCRPDFIVAAARAVNLSSDYAVQLNAPFLHGNKTTIIEWGLKHNVPYQLTHTCYNGTRPACGKCGSCQERLEAFAANGIADPIEYETRELLPKKPRETQQKLFKNPVPPLSAEAANKFVNE